jgi:hypothetical protein
MADSLGCAAFADANSVAGTVSAGKCCRRRDDRNEADTHGKAFSISAPSPSMLWALVDENAASLDDATFAFGMECPAWVDVPGTYHNGGCGFADGHLETHHRAMVR